MSTDLESPDAPPGEAAPAAPRAGAGPVDDVDERGGGATGRGDGTGEGRRPRRGFRLRYALVGVVLVGAVGFLLAKGLSGSLNYFETVDQAMAQKTMLGSKTFRLEGLVLPGTVQRTRDGVSFVAGGTHDKVSVVNTGNPPELFQPDIPVVVVGHFSGSTFVSNQIIVDHTSQYIEEHPNRVRAPNGTVR